MEMLNVQTWDTEIFHNFCDVIGATGGALNQTEPDSRTWGSASVGYLTVLGAIMEC